MDAHTKLLRHLIGEMALMHGSNQGGRVLKFLIFEPISVKWDY